MRASPQSTDVRRRRSARGIVLAIAIASACCRGATQSGPSGAEATPPAPAPSSPLAAGTALRASDVVPLVGPTELGNPPDSRPEEDPLRSRTLRLGFDRVACSLDGSSPAGERDAARCQPLGSRQGLLVAADDQAPTSVMAADGVYDVATAERILPVDRSPPRSDPEAYRLRDGALLALVLEPRGERGERALQLVRRDASGAVARSTVARSAGEIEAGRIVGDWLVVSERSSDREHRLVAHRIVDAGRSLGPGLPFGELRTELRSVVGVRGEACRSPGGAFVVISAQSIELQPGNEHALAMLTGDRWTLVPINEVLTGDRRAPVGLGELGELGCHGAEATLTKQSGGSVVQVRCAAEGCRKLVAEAPHQARGKGPGDVASVDDKILYVWGGGPVFMALSPLAELATAPATPIYRPADGEEVKAIYLFVRQTGAVALLLTSRGALAIRIDGSGAFSPVRRLPP